MKPPIIERADLQTLRHRTVSGVLTVLFWAIWFYLWLPFLALLAWAAGLERAYKEVARYFRQGPLAVQNWQRAQRLSVLHDERGEISRVEVLRR
jgi:TM2 domain-containing membrane protein YozV